MRAMGLDIDWLSTQCVIMEDGRLPTCGNIETGTKRGKTAHGTVRRSAWT
jgi:hypothetical protein